LKEHGKDVQSVKNKEGEQKEHYVYHWDYLYLFLFLLGFLKHEAVLKIPYRDAPPASKGTNLLHPTPLPPTPASEGKGLLAKPFQE